jgi:hypothetical protein
MPTLNLTKSDIVQIAGELAVEPAAVQAVFQVEAASAPFLPVPSKTPSGEDVSGLPKILFEPHVFWKQLRQRDYDPAKLLSRADVRENHGDISDILYPSRGYKPRPYGSVTAQYDRLRRARAINVDAANASASWGAFQVMGYHALDLGWPSIGQFVLDMQELPGQVKAFTQFIKKNGLIPALQKRDWTTFALGYNGKGQAQNKYDKRMAAEYAKAVKQGF